MGVDHLIWSEELERCKRLVDAACEMFGQKMGFNTVHYMIKVDEHMFATLRKMVVTEGNADKLVQRFSGAGIIDKQEGFVDVTVMKQKAKRGEEEIVVMMRWELEAHWKQWEQSDAHIAGHKAKQGQPKPEYIISVESGRYEIQAVRKAAIE